MVRTMKRKLEANQGEEKRLTRGQARVETAALALLQMNAPPSSSNSMNTSNGSDRSRFLKIAKDSEARKKNNVEKLGVTYSESIPAAEDTQSCQQSDQNSSFSITRDLHALINSLLKTCLSPAPAPAVSVPVKEVEVAADNAFNINPSKLPQGELGAKPTVVEEVAADHVSNIVSSKLPREEVRANSMSDDGSRGQSCELGLTELINMLNDGSSEDEAESSTSLVSVGIYKVKKEAACILKDILKKHGDIAAGMTQPVESRAFLLVQVCDFVQKLYQKKFADITQADIEIFSATVSGLQGFELELGWLRKRIEQIREAKRVIHDYSTIKALKARQSQIIRESHGAIEEYQKELWETEQKLSLEYGKLEADQEESKKISERVDNALATINLFSK